MKPRTVSTIGAWLLTAAAAAVAGQTAPSPSTPPTHPTMREAPTTTPDNAAASGRKKGGSLAEAKQACKNMSGEAAQKECLKKAEDDFKKSNPSASAPSQ